MKPQNPEAQAATLAAMTGMAPPNAPQQQPPAPQQQAAPPPPPPPPQPEPPSNESLAPQDAKGDAVTYMVKVGDEEIAMTPEQASGMYQRYNELLGETSQYAPFMKFGKELMSRMPAGTDPSQAVQSMVAALTKNPRMGQPQQPQQQPQGMPAQQTSNQDIHEQLKKWETENATQLPPGYTDMLGLVQGVGGQFQQMQQMMQQLLASTAGQNDATRAGAVQNVRDATDNQKQRLKNNFDRVQQHLGMADQDLEPFLQFAQERGYSIPEFVSIDLLAKVASDFKRAKDEPKMRLLEQVANRRQAYTEEPTGTPNARQSGAPPTKNPNAALENMLKAKGL